MGFTVGFNDMAAPVRTYGLTGFTGIRKVKTRWQDAVQFAMEVMSYPNNVWPSTYGSVNAYAIETNVEAFKDAKMMDAGDGLVYFEDAIVSVKYSTNVMEINRGGERIIGWEELQAYQQAEAVDTHSQLAWEDPDYPGDTTKMRPHTIQESEPYMAPGCIYIRGYSGVRYIPPDLFWCYQRVNDRPFPSMTLGYTFEPETIKLVDIHLKRTFNFYGADAWSVSLKFWYKPNFQDGNAYGWNYRWNPLKQKFVRIVNPQTGDQYKPHIPIFMGALA